VDEKQQLTLPSIRESLIRQEDSIIYNLLERAQYCINPPTYDANRFTIPGFEGSLVEYMLKETEKLHAKVRLAFLAHCQKEYLN
jgi:chorismate mutase